MNPVVVVPTTAATARMAQRCALSWRRAGIEVRVEQLVDDGGWAVYGSEAFNRLTGQKLGVALSVLRDGRDLILADADVVVRSDPLVALERQSAPVAFQDDSPHLGEPGLMACTGFLFARASRSAIDLFETAHTKWRDEDGAVDDQQAMNAVLAETPPDAFEYLPQRTFPNGSVWRAHRPAEATIVHANYVVGERAKTRMLTLTGDYCGVPCTKPLSSRSRTWASAGALHHYAYARPLARSKRMAARLRERLRP